MTAPAMTANQLILLLAAARTFAARHPNAHPETTYQRLDDAARLRCTGRRVLARNDHDPVLPDGGEAFMTAVIRAALTTHPEATMPLAAPVSLADTDDATITELICALASYLDHRTTARLHHTRGLRTWSKKQQADADRSLNAANRILATIGRETS